MSTIKIKRIYAQYTDEKPIDVAVFQLEASSGRVFAWYNGKKGRSTFKQGIPAPSIADRWATPDDGAVFFNALDAFCRRSSSLYLVVYDAEQEQEQAPAAAPEAQESAPPAATLHSGPVYQMTSCQLSATLPTLTPPQPEPRFGCSWILVHHSVVAIPHVGVYHCWTWRLERSA